MNPGLSPQLTTSPWEPDLLPLLVNAVLVLGLVFILLFLANGLGEKKKGPEKARLFESGVIPTGTVRFQYSVPFYLIAAFSVARKWLCGYNDD